MPGADRPRSTPNTTGAGAHLLIDGPITDAGLAGLAGLDGLVELDLFWHVTAMTPDGFAHLRRLPNLQVLGADGELSGDAAMRHIAAIPHLRRLRAQGTAATDEGFEALSQSSTLESLWGRECPHLGSRGFIALSRMPTLRGARCELQERGRRCPLAAAGVSRLARAHAHRRHRRWVPARREVRVDSIG